MLRFLGRMLATVLLLNGLCFLGERVAYGTWYRDGQPVGLYMPDRGGGPRLLPGARLDGLLHSVHVNQDGFRGPEVERPRPADRVRLWCMGGSTTFDIYARDDDGTWPALLARHLDEAWPSTVDVVNAGIPGETVLGAADRLASSDLRPDVVLLYAGPNELAQVQLDAHMGTVGRLPSLAGVRVLRRVFEPAPPVPAIYRGRELSSTALARLRLDLETALEQIQAPHVVLVTHAMRAQPQDTGELARKRVGVTAQLLRLSPEASVRAVDAYNGLLAQVAAERSLTLVDLRSHFDGDERWWGDSVHFSPEGSARAAEVLGQALASLEVAPGGSRRPPHPPLPPPPPAPSSPRPGPPPGSPAGTPPAAR